MTELPSCRSRVSRDRVPTVVRTVLAVVASVAASLLVVPQTQANGTGYLFAYHEGPWPNGGESGVFLSYSSDGFDFTPLNHGQPVFVTPQFPGDDGDSSETNVTRDPSVIYGDDGLYHMVWTSALYTRSFGYASSADLVNWSEPKLVQMWSNPSDTVGRTWAPEWFYDETTEDYMVVFASDVNGQSIRQYYTKTDDFVDFEAPVELYTDPLENWTVIDGSIAKVDENHYVMAVAEGVDGASNVWIVESDSPTGPWTRQATPAVGQWTPADDYTGAEGAALIQIGDLWHMYYDRFWSPSYMALATSPDLVNWTSRTEESSLPVSSDIPDYGTPRHGTVFATPIDSIDEDLLFSMFESSDLTGDGIVDASDWLVFQANHLTDLSGYLPAEQASRGDLNGDGNNDHEDFLIFKSRYNLYYEVYSGAGGDAFAEMLASSTLPEPSALMCVATFAAMTLGARRRLGA